MIINNSYLSRRKTMPCYVLFVHNLLLFSYNLNNQKIALVIFFSSREKTRAYCCRPTVRVDLLAAQMKSLHIK